MNRIRKKRNTLDEHVSIECLLSGLFLSATFFFLCAAFSDPDRRGAGGATVSVERTVVNVRASPQDKKHLRHTNEKDASSVVVTVDEAISVFEDFLKELHQRLMGQVEGESNYHKIHQIYHDTTVEKLYPFDQHYLEHMPERRTDDSIFLSVASYRDENCLNTITQAYSHAQFPDKLNIGLVQQNCVQDCMSGVLKNQETEPVEPDEDCYQLFCESQVGKPHCEAHRVRVLKVDESESLGPYTARYFASKLWNGESWFMQIDSHSTFAQGWDADSISMLQNAPSEKPVISHYPPNTEGLNFRDEAQQPARRICDATFSDFDLDSQIVRLEDNEPWDNEKLDIPRFAPFIAAGYFVAHSGILKEVPFDPFLPWVFMGEEIIMSARFWTHGYDIFSPTHSVVGHMYVRRYKPKYWESVDRFLWDGVDTLVQDLVLHRVKDQLGYPESAPDLVRPKSVFFGVEHYTMGSVRSIEDYMKMVGLDPVRKEANNIDWCQTGQPPEYAKDKSYLYSSSTKSPAQK